MTRLKSVNPNVAIPCLASLNRHKWYLTEELMIMCLADEDLQDEIRSAIATRLTEIPRYYADFDLGNSNFPKCSFDESDGIIGMVSLVGVRSWTIFNMLGLDDDNLQWLSAKVDHWIVFEGYQRFSRFVKSLSVVNDAAERGVKLIQDFINVSNDEVVRQELMLAVSEHRKAHSSEHTKESLKNLS